MKATVADLRAHLEHLEAYLAAKVAMRDWHGVRDAAVDIEVLEAKIGVMEAEG